MARATANKQDVLKIGNGSNRRRRSLAILNAAAAIIASDRLAAPCFAVQTDQWIGGSSNWNNASNWNTASVPGAGDVVHVTSTLGLTQTITYDFPGSITVGTLTVGLTNVSGSAAEILSMSSHQLTAGNEYIGASAGGGSVGEVIQSGGTNTTTRSLLLGASAGDTGSYTLSLNGILDPNSGMVVGGSGSGSFLQGGGSVLCASGDIDVAAASGSVGMYSESGGSANAVDEEIGNSGTGTFTQTGGGNVVTEFMIVGNTGGVGNYSLSGGTLTLDVNDLYIAQDTGNGSFALSGTGSLNVLKADEQIGISSKGTGSFAQSGGTNMISATGTLYLGFLGGTGSYILSNGALTAGTEKIGAAGSASFIQSGGTNTVSVQMLIAPTNQSIGNYAISGGTLTTQNLYVGGTSTATGGTGVLTVSNSGKLALPGTLKVWGGGRVNLNVSETAVGGLTLAGKGIVNLNGELAINYGSPGNDPVVAIAADLASGYNGGNWTGTAGITSSAAAAGAPLLSVGYADGNLDSGTAAAPNQILIMQTKTGDANLDGVVDIRDLYMLAANYGTSSGARWAQGDFDYGGGVDFNDLELLLANYPLPAQGATVLADPALLADSQAVSLLQSDGFVVTALPEPASAGAFVVPAFLFLRRRRRDSCKAVDACPSRCQEPIHQKSS